MGELNNRPKVLPRITVGRQVFRLFFATVLTVFLLFALVLTLVQLPSVQHKGISMLTNWMTERTGVPASIQGFHFNWRGELVLKDVWFADLEGDTLMAAKAIEVFMLRDLAGLFVGRFAITDIHLVQGTLRMKSYPDKKDNLGLFFDKLFPPGAPRDEEKGSVRLDIRRLRMKNFRFIEYNYSDGRVLDIHSGKFSTDVRCIQFSPLDFDFGKVEVDGPAFSLFYDSTLIRGIEEDHPATHPYYGFQFRSIHLKNATVSIKSHDQEPNDRAGGIDFSDLAFSALDLKADHVRFDHRHDYEAKNLQLSFREKSGFELDRLSAAEAAAHSDGAFFYGLVLKTPFSTIGDTLRFNYREYADFLDFNNRVFLECELRQSKVMVRDVLFFAPQLARQEIFRKNPDLLLQIEGSVGSRINNLRGRAIELTIGNLLYLKGDFSSRNLTVEKEQALNLQVDQLNTSVSFLRQLIPGFNPPKQYDRLGTLKFKGRFDGFFVDFVASGKLHTDLGSAVMDMRLDVKRGMAQARYSGNLALQQFHLGRWTQNPNLGTITMHSRVRNGLGLTGKKIEADLTAVIDSLSFKGYRYDDVTLEGKITQDQFIGQLYIQDDAVDFTFNGFVNYGDSIPFMDFQAIINHVDFKKLKLLNVDTKMSAILDLNLRGKDLHTLTGHARLQRLELTNALGNVIESASIVLDIDQRNPRERKIHINSDIADIRLSGQFRIQELPDIFQSRFDAHFPDVVRRFPKLGHPTEPLLSQHVQFELIDHKLPEFIKAFDVKIPEWEQAIVRGAFQIPDSISILHATVPNLKVKDLTFSNLRIRADATANVANIDAEMDSLVVGNTPLNKVSLAVRHHYEDYILRVQVDDEYPLGTNFTTNATLTEEGFRFVMQPDSLVLVNEIWSIPTDNWLLFDTNFLEIHNFQFTSTERVVELKDYFQKGVILHMKDVDIHSLNTYLDFEPVTFDGKVDLDLLVRNIFSIKDLALVAHSDHFMMNGDDFGEMYMMASMTATDSPLEFEFELNNLGERLLVRGIWDRKRDIDKGGYFTGLVRTVNFPISVAEYFLDGAIVNTRGKIDTRINLNGALDQLRSEGYVDVSGFSTVIDYLGVEYSIPDGRIAVTPTMFDATGITMYDPLDNKAILTGGLTHQHFRQWRLACAIESERFMALNTTKKENPYYYGTGIGKLDVRFTGTFDATNIYVKCVTARGSSISIPVSQSSSQVQMEFIEFYNPDSVEEDPALRMPSLGGLQLEMDIEMTEDALVQIIFDERAGDILRGYGRGNLRLLIPRSGNMQMFGSYNIERGDYLFTFQRLVNKSFSVERGGTIQWTGDPFDAQINITTVYNIPGVTPYNLIADFFQGGASTYEQEARRPTEVNLIMNLTGKLLEPEISFDITFPRLFGEIRSLVESKMIQLRRDPNTMYWQAFGLIVANNFLPPDLSTGQGGEYVATINTVSEMISNQFSRYLTVLMSELVADVGIISDIDFNFKYNVYHNTSPSQIEEAFTDSDLKVSQRINFYDDRLSLNIQGSVINTRGIESSSVLLLGGDFQIEYALTEDRRLRMRVYQRSEPTILGNNRYKVGLGLTYRKEWE